MSDTVREFREMVAGIPAETVRLLQQEGADAPGWPTVAAEERAADEAAAATELADVAGAAETVLETELPQPSGLPTPPWPTPPEIEGESGAAVASWPAAETADSLDVEPFPAPVAQQVPQGDDGAAPLAEALPSPEDAGGGSLTADADTPALLDGSPWPSPDEADDLSTADLEGEGEGMIRLLERIAGGVEQLVEAAGEGVGAASGQDAKPGDHKGESQTAPRREQPHAPARQSGHGLSWSEFLQAAGQIV